MRELNEGNTEEHSEGLKKLDTAAIENPELVSSVEERLRNLNAITRKEDKPAVSDEESEDSTPEIKDDDEVKDDDQADGSDDSDDSTPVVKDEVKDDKEKVSVPDAYIRAAIHRGWKQEVIDELIESNPKLAKTTLESLYLDVNNASREWSALGRARRDQTLQEQDRTATETVTEATGVDVKPMIDKLRKEYADDPLIDGVAKLLEDTAKIANAKPKVQVQQGQDQYQTATAHANAAANAAIDQRINSFFSDDVMSPYGEFYGKLKLGQSFGDLSHGQQQNRLAVVEEAEMMISGHAMRGIKLEAEEALEKAHFVVTEPVREQVIRDNLKATATKRKKSMTFRPSESKRSPKSESQDKPRNRKELVSKVEQKLASVFGPK